MAKEGGRASKNFAKIPRSFAPRSFILLIPDSAIAFDVMSEERTFRSEANEILPLSGR